MVSKQKPQDFRVLIACEESQTACKAFRARGFEAYSCDIQEPSSGHPEWHIQGDVLTAMAQQWGDVLLGKNYAPPYKTMVQEALFCD